MAIKNIIKYPNASLMVHTSIAEWPLTPAVWSHMADMHDTLRAEFNGLALASNQIDEHGHRIFVVNDEVAKRIGHQDFINPHWEPAMNSGQVRVNEGCLSFPGISFDVLRYKSVTMKFMDVLGFLHDVELHGLDAQMVQHECDHLNGKLFIQYLDKAKLATFRSEFIRRRKAGSW